MNKYIILFTFSIFTFLSTAFANENTTLKKAYFAGGCFWGVEHHFENKKGVKDVISGFMGGHIKNPGYYDVIKGKTGHVEAVEVLYNSKEITYEELAKLFFEIHDSTQKDGQGPDIGSQYLSVVFYKNEEEKTTTMKLINILKSKGIDAATTLKEISPFYAAEEYHQDYYDKTGKLPYCHIYKKIFD